jgi:hypothetical protein
VANRSQNAQELKTLKLSFRLSDFEPDEADAVGEPDDSVCDVEVDAYELHPGIYRIAGPQSLTAFGPYGPLLNLGSVIQVELQGDRTCRYVRTLESPSIWTILVVAPVRLEVIGREDVKRHLDALLDLGCGWEWCVGNVTIQGLQSGPTPGPSEAVSDAIAALESLLVGPGAPTEPRVPADARLPPRPRKNQNSDDRAIIVACETGNKKAISAAIAAGANMNFVFSETGQTPLTACLRFGKYELVEPLIYKGQADLNLPNKDGQTPLHIICLATEEKLLSWKRLFGVRKWDAMTTILRNHPNVNAQDSRGRTPLHYAVICGERSYMKRLFGELANADIRDGEGFTPEELMIATAKTDIEGFFASKYNSFRR